MESIQSRTQISYQLLISAIETLATIELQGWKPTDDEVLKDNPRTKKAIELKISGRKARQLGLASVTSNPWTARKFVKFIQDRIPVELWTTEDSLYKNEASKLFEPSRENCARALRKIYNARSGASHGGESFPASSTIGPGPFIRTK